jgi:hypothetical protein
MALGRDLLPQREPGRIIANRPDDWAPNAVQFVHVLCTDPCNKKGVTPKST